MAIKLYDSHFYPENRPIFLHFWMIYKIDRFICFLDIVNSCDWVMSF